MNNSRVWVSAIFLMVALVAMTAWAPGPIPSEHAVVARVALQQGTPASQGNSLAIGQSATLGSYLTDGQGMTVYMFAPDTSTTSACDATCAQTWPPLPAQGTPTVPSGIDTVLIGAIQRSDGTTQLTFNSHPLYHFAGDTKAGDTNGEGIAGKWFVVSPTGNPIGTTGTVTPGSPSTAGTPSPSGEASLVPTVAATANPANEATLAPTSESTPSPAGESTTSPAGAVTATATPTPY